MESFELARSDGADAIEFDVHRTIDAAFVVIHDFTLDRTTDGSGFVAGQRLDAVRSLDAGSWFSPDFAAARVPTLEEVLAIEGMEFELEMRVLEPQELAALVDQVLATGVLDRVEFTSSNSPMLMALKRKTPQARIGVFSPRRQDWMHDQTFQSFVISRAVFAGADVVHVHAKDITASMSEELHSRGFVVHANDSNTDADVENARAVGADRTTTNDPGSARQQLS